MEIEKNKEIEETEIETVETSITTRTIEIKENEKIENPELGKPEKSKKSEKSEIGNFQQPRPRRKLKSKITAGILALFLGGIGIHKFYLGKIIQGILYVLFAWTPIPYIIAFIEGIILLTMNQREFDRRYNNGFMSEPSYIPNCADEILKFKKLLDNGVITQEEFNRKKQELLQ